MKVARSAYNIIVLKYYRIMPEKISFMSFNYTISLKTIDSIFTGRAFPSIDERMMNLYIITIVLNG